MYTTAVFSSWSSSFTGYLVLPDFTHYQRTRATALLLSCIIYYAVAIKSLTVIILSSNSGSSRGLEATLILPAPRQSPRRFKLLTSSPCLLQGARKCKILSLSNTTQSCNHASQRATVGHSQKATPGRAGRPVPGRHSSRSVGGPLRQDSCQRCMNRPALAKVYLTRLLCYSVSLQPHLKLSVDRLSNKLQ